MGHHPVPKPTLIGATPPQPEVLDNSRFTIVREPDTSVTPILVKKPNLEPVAKTIQPPPKIPTPKPLAPVQTKALPPKPFPPIPPRPSFELGKLLTQEPKTTQAPHRENPPQRNQANPTHFSKSIHPRPPKPTHRWHVFMEDARIQAFDPNLEWNIQKHSDCNDDLSLGGFLQSKKVWAGTQKRGISPEITDARDYLDHIHQAVRADFPLTADIPLPGELTASIDWISEVPTTAATEFWEEQLIALKNLVSDAASTQVKWDSFRPPELGGAGGGARSVAILSLLRQFNLGGDRWMSQFIFGFPTCGIFSQSGVFPTCDKAKPPVSLSVLWKSSQKRFRERAKASGYKNAVPLWAEALEQVSSGWLSEPLPISANGDVPGLQVGSANIAFRFGVEQQEKLRACDDLRHNMVNLCTSVLTPITLPTWDHISQLSKNVYKHRLNWVFLKTDHADAYKQLPLDPDYANLTVVALRGPNSGKWCAFIPKVLLFGAVSAVIHYNCFSRILAVLMNLTLGIPILNYFDDFGAYCPEPLGTRALSTVEDFNLTLGAPMKTQKSEVDRVVKFLGLLGSFPGIDTDFLLHISLPQDKIVRWSQITLDHMTEGRITHKNLERLVGKLSYTQTSVFGRFGRTLLKPLIDKANARPFVEKFSERELDILSWWVESIRASTPRIIELKPQRPEVIIYTDAATSTRVVAACVLHPENFPQHQVFSELRAEVSNPLWEVTLAGTTYIYGLEMLAIVAIILVLGEQLRNKNVTIYIDNSNARDALVRGYTDTKAVDKMVQIFWAHVQRLGISVWFELIPSGVNPADTPTRDAPLPLPAEKTKKFGILEAIRIWIDSQLSIPATP